VSGETNSADDGDTNMTTAQAAIESMVNDAGFAFADPRTSDTDRALCADLVAHAGAINAKIERFVSMHRGFTVEACGYYAALVQIVIDCRDDLTPSYEGGEAIWKAC
jgi:hypothetical protein